MYRTLSIATRLSLALALFLLVDARVPLPPPEPSLDDGIVRPGTPCLRESTVGSAAGFIINADALMQTESGSDVDEARSREVRGHAALSTHAVRMIGVCTDSASPAAVGLQSPAGAVRRRPVRA